jgi:hypothetical protein
MASAGRAGRRVRMWAVISSEVVPIISAKIGAVFGEACLGVKGVEGESEDMVDLGYVWKVLGECGVTRVEFQDLEPG